MKRTIILIAFFYLSVSQLGISQDSFYKSSIIKLNGDTLKGYISNLFDSKTIKFKKSLRDKEIIFTPTEIKGFMLDGNTFESRGVLINSYKYESTQAGVQSFLTLDYGKGKIKDTVFLQKIINGKVSLYSVKYSDNSSFLFAESNGVLREIPREFNIIVRDSVSKGKVTQFYNNTNVPFSQNTTIYEFRSYLDTLAVSFNDNEYNRSFKPFSYSERKIKSTIAGYNRKVGIRSGGFIKSNVPLSLFVGGSIGRLIIKEDDVFKYENATTSLSGRLYGLLPLIGIDRHASVKLGINYFTYSNSTSKKDIWSSSLGLRYSSLSGWVRPYGEVSLSLCQQFKNSERYPLAFPTIFEGGVLIPINEMFLTLGISSTPLRITGNGYQFWVFHIGVML